MFWHSRMWAGAVFLCALAFASDAEAARKKKTPPADAEAAPADAAPATPAPAAVVPAAVVPAPVVVAAPAPVVVAERPVVVVPAAVVVSLPPDDRSDDWSVFTGRGTRGGHLATVALGIGDTFVPEASYRYSATDNIGIGFRAGWGPSFLADDDPNESIINFDGLRLSLALTAELMHNGRWSLGFDVSPGLLWQFKECSQCTEERVGLLYLSMPLLYAVVPRVFSIGAAVDVLTDFNFQESHITVDFPILVGGIVEYHVSRNFALTAEAKFGAWFNTFVSQSAQPVFLISRFGVGLAFYGVP